MSEINTDTGGGGKGKHGGGKVRAKKQSTRIDMTPMVDLAFLLLTFFMLTTTFSKPKTMEINVPVKPDHPEPTTEQPIKESQALTIILTDDDKVHYYPGFVRDSSNLLVTDFSKNGIRKILLARNKKVYDKIEDLRKKYDMGEMKRDTFKARSARIKIDDKKGIVVLIKTTSKAKYKNVVNILDEMNICNIGRYALLELQAPDIKLLTKANIKL